MKETNCNVCDNGRRTMLSRPITVFLIAVGLLGCTNASDNDESATSLSLSGAEVKSLAKESYIALYPLVYNYGTMYNQAVNPDASEYIGGFGVFKHYGLSTPENRDIPTPNNNTPYSWAWVDLTIEPWILTMPPIDGNRYYVSQWDDMWGYVIDAPGSIIDGQGGGKYLLATTDYDGTIPQGIERVIYSESQFAGTLTRTGVSGESDLEAMKAVQNGYDLQPLSSYMNSDPPVGSTDHPWPIYNPEDLNNIHFFRYANFMLSYLIPERADETMLLNAKKIGIAAGLPWNPEEMDSAFVEHIEAGIHEAQAEIDQQVAITIDGKKLYNTREVIGEDYLNRTVGVIVGQFGNYPSQAMYPGFQKDGNGNFLDGSKNNYSITFPPGRLPKSDYFWSFTMYDLPGRFLVNNPINRYSIGSQTSTLKKEADGSTIVYFQHESPGADKEGNWLPAPAAPFYTVLRIYGPGEDVINGTYSLPQMVATPIK